MKLPIITFAAVAILFTACQSNNKADKTIDSASKAVISDVKSTKECYVFTKNKDTAMLSIDFSGKDVTGTLNYNLYEKDKNSGTISGIVKGDTIMAEYTFNAEGTQSVRQVAFLKKEGKLLEGFGEVEEKGGKVTFKDPKSLQFNTQYIVFDQTECK